MSNVYTASNQWASRPDDERFESLDALYLATLAMKESAKQKIVEVIDIKATVVGDEVMLAGKQGKPARISNWGFNQLSSLAKAPAGYLQDISPELAAANLNYGLAKRDNSVKLLLQDSGDNNLPLLVRSANGPEFGRIWSSDVVLNTSLHVQQDKGWRVPPARPAREGQKGTRLATAADILAFGKSGLSIKIGDPIGPAGLYYGPSSGMDTFMFFVNEDRRIGHEDSLCRFFMLWNSEVGASYFGGMFGYYDTVCGNHILWDTKGVMEFKIKHIGNMANERAFWQLEESIKKFSDKSIGNDEALLLKARNFIIAPSKDEVVDTLYAKKIAGQKVLVKAYEIAEANPRYGDPKSAWAMMSGLTEYSQTLPFADKRVEMDRQAGKLLAMVN